VRVCGDCVKIAAPVAIDPDFWTGRRVLITGHTGFKGAWLALWLQSLGAQVSGLARGTPRAPSLFELAAVGTRASEYAVDVRDGAAAHEALREAAPEVVFHLAAQPTVRRSLRDPLGTYAVNVLGTVNVLEAVRTAGAEVRAVLVVTSDKCYANSPVRTRPFVESDPLGGDDPYSSSKACIELIVSAYRRSYFADDRAPLLATARTGNVIGGGDWGEGRLLADAMRAVQSGQPLKVRNPLAVRSWQHVLNPLSGYLQLAQALCEGERTRARAWNFGPPPGDARAVGWIVERLAELWDGALRWELDARENPPEAPRPALDSSDAAQLLEWRPPWGLADALAAGVKWHRAHMRGADMRVVSLRQIEMFATTRSSNLPA
jgi:CDP-glucose 4,6-dehydratase